MPTDLPKFVEDDPALIRQAIIDEYERLTNKRLFPAQADNFVLNELAYREALTKSQFNAAMLQNFVQTASGVFLNALGAFWGVKRLPDEPDDKLRIRILLAPEALTTAGTRGAYEFFIRSADPSISAVGFANPDPGSGTVKTFILTDDGLPTDELLLRVYQTLTDEKIRVLCVTYQVAAPDQVSYQVKAEITAKRSYELQVVKREVEAVVLSFTRQLALNLGNDIISSKFIDVIHNVSGVHSVHMLSPAVDQELNEGQWPVNNGIVIDVEAQADDE